MYPPRIPDVSFSMQYLYHVISYGENIIQLTYENYFAKNEEDYDHVIVKRVTSGFCVKARRGL